MRIFSTINFIFLFVIACTKPNTSQTPPTKPAVIDHRDGMTGIFYYRRTEENMSFPPLKNGYVMKKGFVGQVMKSKLYPNRIYIGNFEDLPNCVYADWDGAKFVIPSQSTGFDSDEFGFVYVGGNPKIKIEIKGILNKDKSIEYSLLYDHLSFRDVKCSPEPLGNQGGYGANFGIIICD